MEISGYKIWLENEGSEVYVRIVPPGGFPDAIEGDSLMISFDLSEGTTDIWAEDLIACNLTPRIFK